MPQFPIFPSGRYCLAEGKKGVNPQCIYSWVDSSPTPPCFSNCTSIAATAGTFKSLDEHAFSILGLDYYCCYCSNCEHTGVPVTAAAANLSSPIVQFFAGQIIYLSSKFSSTPSQASSIGPTWSMLKVSIKLLSVSINGISLNK